MQPPQRTHRDGPTLPLAPLVAPAMLPHNMAMPLSPNTVGEPLTTHTYATVALASRNTCLPFGSPPYKTSPFCVNFSLVVLASRETESHGSLACNTDNHCLVLHAMRRREKDTRTVADNVPAHGQVFLYCESRKQPRPTAGARNQFFFMWSHSKTNIQAPTLVLRALASSYD